VAAHIWVYSEPGQGTTFKIYLPRITQVPKPESLPVSAAFKDRGTETILVVEDEEVVRQVTCKILRTKGYEVLEAGSGSAALVLSEQHPGGIQLLLTDVLMPEMSGRDLAQRLARQRPEIRVLFMSGHTENAIVHHGVLKPGIAFIQKPFRLETLVHKVRKVLDGSSE
jgi:two-component system cell cycle sensor histidine kinase/response regulator CckA